MVEAMKGESHLVEKSFQMVALRILVVHVRGKSCRLHHHCKAIHRRPPIGEYQEGRELDREGIDSVHRSKVAQAERVVESSVLHMMIVVVVFGQTPSGVLGGTAVLHLSELRFGMRAKQK